MATTKTDWEAKDLGCMWKREKQGTKEKYLTGVLNANKLRKVLETAGEEVQLVVFSNKNKTKDNHPDLRIYLSEKRNGTKPDAPATRTAPAAKPTPAATPPNDDLI